MYGRNIRGNRHGNLNYIVLDYSDYEDSGIDSETDLFDHPKDDRDEHPFFHQLSDDEELRYLNYLRSNLERDFQRHDGDDYMINRARRPRAGPCDSPLVGRSPPRRRSPPLYEVELSQTEEDDESSVLELVIPVRSPRYPRKKKSNFKSMVLGTFLCCFSRRK